MNVTNSNDASESSFHNSSSPGDLEERLEYLYKMLEFTHDQKQNKHKVTEIDYVLDDIIRMDFVSVFPNLKRLILIKQGIYQIEGLDELANIEEIWLNENEITSIAGLDGCKSLKKLFLCTNKLTRIAGLESLESLEVMWLDENQIESLDGVPVLPKLREFSIAMNKIENIGTGLDGLDKLESINMAGNKIGNFKELLNLNRLPSLKVATFFDPHYGDNPICNL